MSSVFSKILKGEIPGHIVAEDDKFFAILDISPLAKGHTLVIPKEEVDYIFDLSAEVLGGYLAFSKKIAKAIESVVPCTRVGVAVIGLEVPHAHIHLVPINQVGDIDFSKPKLKLEEREFVDLASSIRNAVIECDQGSA